MIAEPQITCETLGPCCMHCGLPLLNASNHTGFCCLGCQQVHNILKRNGLDHYYDLRKLSVTDLKDVKPANPSGQSYEYFNDPDFLASHAIKLSSGSLQCKLFLQGIQCAACVWLLEKLPDICEGLESVQVDFAKSVITVTFDPNETNLQQIAASTNNLGYPPTPYEADMELEFYRKSSRLLLLQLGVAGFCAGNTMMIAVSLYQGYFSGIAQEYQSFLSWVSLLITIPAVTFSAQPFIKAAFASLKIRKVHIDLPISIGIVGGFLGSVINTFLGNHHVYFDSICMLIFLLLVGRYLQHLGVQKALSKNSLESQVLPTFARVKDGERYEERYIKSVKRDGVVQVKAGEKIPVDGSVLHGESAVDNSFLTGESAAQKVGPGSVVFAGATNVVGTIEVKAIKDYYGSRIFQILNIIRAASSSKSQISTKIDRLSHWFVWSVISITFANFLMRAFTVGLEEAFVTSIAMLIVTCPCALGLAAPLAVAQAIGLCAKRGILIKSADSFEKLLAVRHFYFDKTGTITDGNFTILDEHFLIASPPRDFFARVFALEVASAHPVQAAFATRAQLLEGEVSRLQNFEVLSGQGVKGTFDDGVEMHIGSLGFMQTSSIELSEEAEKSIERIKSNSLTMVLVAMNKKLVAVFGLGDTLRKNARQLFDGIRGKGKREVFLLSGDHRQAVVHYAQQLNLDKEHALYELSPEQKYEVIRNDTVVNCMVGDGVNDLAAIKEANLGIGVTGGSEANLLVADCYINQFTPALFSKLLGYSRSVLSVINRNIYFSLVYNVAGATLALNGTISPLTAAILMPISSFTVIISSQILNFKD